MTIRDELIIRIVEDRLIDGTKCLPSQKNVITNYQLMQLSFLFERWVDNSVYAWSGNESKKIHFIRALPDSIMRNFRGLAEEYNDEAEYNFDVESGFCNRSIYDRPDIAYHFNHASKTDYHLSKGFIKWLEDECKKIMTASGS